MIDSQPVTLTVATRDRARVLSNLLNLYMHDLSDVFPIEPGTDGRFRYPKLRLYWSEPEKRFPFLIHAGSQLAGFALITRGSPVTDDPEVFDVAEFFVLRAHRRAGVGRQAAFHLWSRFPGPWVVRVLDANRAGLGFWRAAIREYTRGAFSEEPHPESPQRWQVFTFVSPAQAK